MLPGINIDMVAISLFIVSILPWTPSFLSSVQFGSLKIAIRNLEERVNQTKEETEKKLEQFKKQSELDVEALNLTYRQLNPNPDIPEVSQEALDTAVASASRPIKVQIFNQAYQVRRENWHDNSPKPKMERTIPVFRALIHNDVEGRYHRNHGQLGYALKDRRHPEWAEAEKELSAAIQMRGPWQEHGWLLYEFNRAICRIMLDPSFGNNQPSSLDRNEKILRDLRDAAHTKELKRRLLSDKVVQKWMTLNNITGEALQPA